jgi:hypothetical protein
MRAAYADWVDGWNAWHYPLAVAGHAFVSVVVNDSIYEGWSVNLKHFGLHEFGSTTVCKGSRVCQNSEFAKAVVNLYRLSPSE